MAPSYELYDDDAWDRGEPIWLEWKKKLFNEAKHRLGTPVRVYAPQKGAFNVYYQVRFADGESAITRFPIPAYYKFAEEKIRIEVAVMRYLYIEHACDVVDVLNVPGTPLEVKPFLNPDIDEAILEVYRQMADILLQISTCDFRRSGAQVLHGLMKVAVLSCHMRRNWETGDFWLTYAARKTWAFDGIYWKFLDKRFWMQFGNFLERLKHLSKEQVDAMEPFVKRRLEEKKERTSVDWYQPGAEAQLPEDPLG
ncbi:hypothetical protein VTK73DRAFT_3632 [Phialemonium thermophilum]|uniref:Aminoglycoside phosphotransferase domain-containing protein n=1 Tax=Phialemonium thermophilum TaxID=223376 RepID=A0ABR3WXX0_9PEZI